MNKVSRLAGLTLILFCANISYASTDDANKPQVFSFGIVPQQSATKLAKKWVPILRYVSKQTGIKLRFATASNIPVFESRLAEGKYDFSYMNPYHFTVFHESPGYQAFAKVANKYIKGIVVVHKDSVYSDIAELKDQTVVFPAPAAFAATILPKANFKNEGIAINYKYVSSHDSVYRNVAAGLFPAGGGILRTLGNVDPEIKNQLRVLWTSKGYTPHAFATHSRVSDEIVTSVRRVMDEMSEDPEGQALLEAINVKDLEPANNEDWDDVRALNLHLLDDDK